MPTIEHLKKRKKTNSLESNSTQTQFSWKTLQTNSMNRKKLIKKHQYSTNKTKNSWISTKNIYKKKLIT